MRQVGIVDAHGGVAVHTGAGCIPEAGDARGEHWTCQANMMERRDRAGRHVGRVRARPRATSPSA